MHFEYRPADAPDPNDPDVTFSVAPKQITTELLELCAQFFWLDSPTVRTALCLFLWSTPTFVDT